MINFKLVWFNTRLSDDVCMYKFKKIYILRLWLDLKLNFALEKCSKMYENLKKSLWLEYSCTRYTFVAWKAWSQALAFSQRK